MSDRPASILTGSQREFVTGDKDPSNPRVYRSRIRDRVEWGMYDLMLLFKFYDTDEIRDTFESAADHISTNEGFEPSEQRGGAGSVYSPEAIAFLIHALNRTGREIFPNLTTEKVKQPALTPFCKAAERGVEKYLDEKTEYTADVDVSITLENVQHQEEFLENLRDE